MNKRNHHGIYVFDRTYFDENILIARLVGSWNLETSKEAVEEILQIAKNNFSGQEWGTLNDFREWGLCPPEVIEYFDQSAAWFTQLNYRWQAVIPSNQIDKMIVNDFNEASQGVLTTKQFTNEGEALSWLRSKMNKSK